MTRHGLCDRLAHSSGTGASCGPGGSEGSAEVEGKEEGGKMDSLDLGLLKTHCDFFQLSG